jgi:hypothetical protein
MPKRGLSPAKGGAGNMLYGWANENDSFLPNVGVLRSRWTNRIFVKWTDGRQMAERLVAKAVSPLTSCRLCAWIWSTPNDGYNIRKCGRRLLRILFIVVLTEAVAYTVSTLSNLHINVVYILVYIHQYYQRAQINIFAYLLDRTSI